MTGRRRGKRSNSLSKMLKPMLPPDAATFQCQPFVQNSCKKISFRRLQLTSEATSNPRTHAYTHKSTLARRTFRLKYTDRANGVWWSWVAAAVVSLSNEFPLGFTSRGEKKRESRRGNRKWMGKKGRVEKRSLLLTRATEKKTTLPFPTTKLTEMNETRCFYLSLSTFLLPWWVGEKEQEKWACLFKLNWNIDCGGFKHSGRKRGNDDCNFNLCQEVSFLPQYSQKKAMQDQIMLNDWESKMETVVPEASFSFFRSEWP